MKIRSFVNQFRFSKLYDNFHSIKYKLINGRFVVTHVPHLGGKCMDMVSMVNVAPVS